MSHDTDALTPPSEVGLDWVRLDDRQGQAVLRRPTQPSHPRRPPGAANPGRGALAGRPPGTAAGGVQPDRPWRAALTEAPAGVYDIPQQSGDPITERTARAAGAGQELRPQPGRRGGRHHPLHPDRGRLVCRASTREGRVATLSPLGRLQPRPLPLDHPGRDRRGPVAALPLQGDPVPQTKKATGRRSDRVDFAGGEIGASVRLSRRGIVSGSAPWRVVGTRRDAA